MNKNRPAADFVNVFFLHKSARCSRLFPAVETNVVRTPKIENKLTHYIRLATKIARHD